VSWWRRRPALPDISADAALLSTAKEIGELFSAPPMTKSQHSEIILGIHQMLRERPSDAQLMTRAITNQILGSSLPLSMRIEVHRNIHAILERRLSWGAPQDRTPEEERLAELVAESQARRAAKKKAAHHGDRETRETPRTPPREDTRSVYECARCGVAVPADRVAVPADKVACPGCGEMPDCPSCGRIVRWGHSCSYCDALRR
jgi:DNA-directed RNA polymerase subunit RPC12/RpoP